MAFLVVGNQRYALQIGETTLGGSRDASEIPLPLASAHATVSLTPEGTTTLRREGDAPVSVNSVRLGAEPVVLRHGDRIQAGGVLIVFGDIAAAGSTALGHAVPESAVAALAGAFGGGPTADSGGRLVHVRDGAVTPIPSEGLVIGRDPGCDLVLADRGASRRHATVRPSLQGYLIADHSVNGLTVNGRRIDGTQVLGMGDIVRIGDDEFRFEADAASFEPDIGLLEPVTRESTAAAHGAPGAGSSDARVAPAGPATVEKPQPQAPTLLATLEVLNKGVHEGTRFRVERPVAQVGRSRQSDVRLDDDSVSGTHATIVRRGAGWVVIDLDSTNGTYVDGTRVRGEQAIEGPCELRFGGIKTLFRPLAGGAADDTSTRVIVGMPDGTDRR